MCFSEAARSGLPEAQYELGVCYRDGEGTEQDIKTAMYWYEKAASHGYLRAYQNMGIIYQNGKHNSLHMLTPFNSFLFPFGIRSRRKIVLLSKTNPFLAL